MSKKELEGDIAVAEKQKIKEPSMYNIVLHDNDETSVEEVKFIVIQAFNFNHDTADSLAMKVHHEGKAVCGTYTREIAQIKLQHIEMIKQSLASMIIDRRNQIMMLKFTIEKV